MSRQDEPKATMGRHETGSGKAPSDAGQNEGAAAAASRSSNRSRDAASRAVISPQASETPKSPEQERHESSALPMIRMKTGAGSTM